jgi:hypothetical protein
MSCDASSEDSDYAVKQAFPSQLSASFNGRASNLLTVPSNATYSQPQMMQRKRRHQRPPTNSFSILKNLGMEQSVYEQDLMSQSLNLPNINEKGSRKRVIRRRMRRTASDNTDLGIFINRGIIFLFNLSI